MKSDRSSEVQYAALPWRRQGPAVEVMLLTSRESRRWVIPKGWPMHGCEPAECAAHEAYEEGGVEGRVDGLVGAYTYDKGLKDGRTRRLSVVVFAMEVETELSEWPEAAERERRWFQGLDAANAVAEPDLAALIRDFSEASAPPRT